MSLFMERLRDLRRRSGWGTAGSKPKPEAGRRTEVERQSTSEPKANRGEPRSLRAGDPPQVEVQREVVPQSRRRVSRRRAADWLTRLFQHTRRQFALAMPRRMDCPAALKGLLTRLLRRRFVDALPRDDSEQPTSSTKRTRTKANQEEAIGLTTSVLALPTRPW